MTGIQGLHQIIIGLACPYTLNLPHAQNVRDLLIPSVTIKLDVVGMVTGFFDMTPSLTCSLQQLILQPLPLRRKYLPLFLAPAHIWLTSFSLFGILVDQQS